MPHRYTSLRKRLTEASADDFDQLAIEVFHYQRATNGTYRRYLDLSGQRSVDPKVWTQIPCLPIGLFRGHDLRSGDWTPETQFRSSGTSGADTSTMPVYSVRKYLDGCRETFTSLIGRPADYTILALLPGYLERGDSGLIAMVDDLVSVAADGSGFFLDDFEALEAAVARTGQAGSRVLLWGVTHALLRLAKGASCVLPKGSLIIETGGMKGHGPELTRAHLHRVLREAFGAPVYSEYGMTELSSQAYLAGASDKFSPGRLLRARARDLTDPFTVLPPARQGALNLYDLANVDTCCFLQSDDLGKVYPDEGFEVLGRVDRTVARGCNLLVGDL